MNKISKTLQLFGVSSACVLMGIILVQASYMIPGVSRISDILPKFQLEDTNIIDNNFELRADNGKMNIVGQNDAFDSPSYLMTMTSDGNMGIGTQSPGAKLDVEGNIRAQMPIANNDLAPKQYVDSVLANGGGSSSGGGPYTAYNTTSCAAGYKAAYIGGNSNGFCFAGGGSNCAICVPSSGASSGKRMFVTSTGYQGNLGGELGADAKCQSRADAAGLGGTFKAWLLDGTGDTDITDKFIDTKYVSVVGSTVITTFLAYDGNNSEWQYLEGSIFFDEFGRTPNAFDEAWTGLGNDGSPYSSSNCSNFTSTNNSARTGNSTRTNSQWYTYTNRSCSSRYRLICAEA